VSVWKELHRLPVRHLNPDPCTFQFPLPELVYWQEHLQPSELEPLALASKKLTSQALAAIARALVDCSRKEDISHGKPVLYDVSIIIEFYLVLMDRERDCHNVPKHEDHTKHE
jgi:hypothetical protein